MRWTDCLQPKRTAIPAYMPVMLDVAIGFKYGTKADFQHFGKELQNAVQRFDKMPLLLCHGNLMHQHHQFPIKNYKSLISLCFSLNYRNRNKLPLSIFVSLFRDQPPRCPDDIFIVTSQIGT